MRPIQLILALVVCAATYMLVIERDRVLLFAKSLPFSGPEGEVAEPVNVEGAEGDDATMIVDSDDGSADPVSVVVKRSVAVDVEKILVLRGRTEAYRHVDVKSETSGRVISEPLRKGTMVDEGQLLCELDVGSRDATLLEARARLIDAENRTNVSAKLAQQGFGSETAAIADSAALEAARSAVIRAEKEIERLRIFAPFPGLLETDTAELGTLLQPGSSCAIVVSLDPINLVGFADEVQVEQLEVGSEAHARLASGREVSGKLSFVSRRADQGARTFRVEVTAPNPDLAIRDGATAEIVISLMNDRGHLLPQSALTLDDRGRLGVRTVDESGLARFMPVSIIRDTLDGVWLEGLPENADVIVVGQEFVLDGRPVAITYQAAES